MKAAPLSPHTILLVTSILVFTSTAFAVAATISSLKSPKVDVPTSDQMFPDGPGSDETNNNCLACHSADHILNQPSLTKEGWSEVVHKMVSAYKAPVDPGDQSKIIDYLTSIKGKP